MKPFRSVPIVDGGEPLVAPPPGSLTLLEPHAYAALGAPYGGASPWLLRSGVLDRLLAAAGELQQRRPGWRLAVFDAYRPNAVQAFMVWREFRLQAERAGRSLAAYDNPAALRDGEPALYAVLAPRVFEFWSEPSEDPGSPPPHSTGAALDLTLRDESGGLPDMGCPIDETSERAYPDHFAAAATAELQACHARRQLLYEVMSGAGFCRHPNEWWHFSFGDQLWAWLRGERAARYGRARPGA